jgi:hypothetical protein
MNKKSTEYLSSSNRLCFKLSYVYTRITLYHNMESFAFGLHPHKNFSNQKGYFLFRYPIALRRFSRVTLLFSRADSEFETLSRVFSRYEMSPFNTVNCWFSRTKSASPLTEDSVCSRSLSHSPPRLWQLSFTIKSFNRPGWIDWIWSNV